MTITTTKFVMEIRFHLTFIYHSFLKYLEILQKKNKQKIALHVID